MASRQNLIPNCELLQPSHTHTHAGVECSSLAVSGVPKFPQLLSWACEWILIPDILSSAGTVLTCTLYPIRCKRKHTSVQPCPHQSNAKSTEHADLTEHAKTKQLCSTSMQCFISNLCFAYSSASRTSKKNCASHDCRVPHHCRLVSSLFEIRHAKTSLVQTCQKMK